jgi:ABC-2 type transport system ATP-binding protein
MEEADQLCQRVAIVDHGRLLALDTPAALKHSVGVDTELRIQATGDLNDLARVLQETRGVESARVVEGTVYAYVKSDGLKLPEIINVAEQHGFAVHDVGVKETTLESVFIKLTGRELRE